MCSSPIHPHHIDIQDCRKRWYHTLDPNIRRGRWTDSEDEALRQAFSQVGAQWQRMGGCNFIRVVSCILDLAAYLQTATYVPGRTAEQVAKRWRDVLDPGLVLKAPWTPDEDALLVAQYCQHGPKWTLISDAFPSRNGIACRNRFRRFRNAQERNSGTSHRGSN